MYSTTKKLGDLHRRLIESEGGVIDIETGELLDEQSAKQLRDELFAEILAGQENEAEIALKAIRDDECSLVAIDAEIKRLSELKTAKRNRVERLKDLIRIGMIATGAQAIKTNLGDFKISKGRESVVVHDFERLKQIHPELVRTKVIEEPDKKAIGDAIKDGVDLAGAAEKVRGEPTLSIK